MCKWLDSLEFTSGQCGVSAQATAVEVKIAASPSEAGQICETIAGTMRKDGVKFDRGWKLRVIDPKNSGKKLAECGL